MQAQRLVDGALQALGLETALGVERLAIHRMHRARALGEVELDHAMLELPVVRRRERFAEDATPQCRVSTGKPPGALLRLGYQAKPFVHRRPSLALRPESSAQREPQGST